METKQSDGLPDCGFIRVRDFVDKGKPLPICPASYYAWVKRGILIFRDELVGWLRSMDREGNECSRAFYLEAWNETVQGRAIETAFPDAQPGPADSPGRQPGRRPRAHQAVRLPGLALTLHEILPLHPADRAN